MTKQDDADLFSEPDDGLGDDLGDDLGDGLGEDEIPGTDPAAVDYASMDDKKIIALADKAVESGQSNQYTALDGWNNLIREDLDRTKRGEPFSDDEDNDQTNKIEFSFDDLSADSFNRLVTAGKEGDAAEILRIGKSHPGMIENHFPGLARS